MSQAHARKPFSVERRQLGRASVPSFPQELPMGSAATEGGPLLEEIRALRSELHSLKEELAPELAARETQSAGSDSSELGISDVRAVQVEIAQMVKMIAKAKNEIASIKHPMSEDDRLLSASNELDAIVMATEAATHDILNATEGIEREMMNLAALCHDDTDVVEATERVSAHLTNVMESCNFQDITGQRITKVVDTMRFIEERIVAMIDIWGVEAFADLPIPRDSFDNDDEGLLNGPQLQDQGISQADIDALFD